MKRAVTFLVVFLLIAANLTCMASQYDSEAEKLKTIGVFIGTDNGFELDRAPTRLEGAIMFVRLLGAESTAKQGNAAHPFKDVPDWGSPYVGYLYSKGLAKGISASEFGSSNTMDAKSYLTFMLRSLNYSDTNGDFSWSLAIEKSNEIGLIDASLTAELKAASFLRDHVAAISYKTLTQKTKGSYITLAQKLVAEGALNEDAAISMGVISSGTSNLFSTGSPLSVLKESDIVALGANGFTGTAQEIATKIKDWQVSHMIYASDSQSYQDVSYSMRWNYAFPGLYTTKDMLANMKDGSKIYGICYNYAVIFADIANYYGLDVRITNTTVKPSEVSSNPFYKSTSTGMSPDEYSAFKNWIVSKGLSADDYPYEAVRLVMAETALHYRAEVKIDGKWVPFDTYRSENTAANQYTYVLTNWQEGNKADLFKSYVARIKNGEDLRSDENIYQTYKGFLEGRLIRLQSGELDSYKGVTDDLGRTKRAANLNDLLQGYGLAPYYNNKSDILTFMGNPDWLSGSIDKLLEMKTSIESQSDVKFNIIAQLILIPRTSSDTIPYNVYVEQYLGYTGDDLSTVLSKSMYNQYLQLMLIQLL